MYIGALGSGRFGIVEGTLSRRDECHWCLIAAQLPGIILLGLKQGCEAGNNMFLDSVETTEKGVSTRKSTLHM